MEVRDGVVLQRDLEMLEDSKDKGLFFPSKSYLLIFQGNKSCNAFFCYPRRDFLTFWVNEHSLSRKKDDNVTNSPDKAQSPWFEISSPTVQPSANAGEYWAHHLTLR